MRLLNLFPGYLLAVASVASATEPPRHQFHLGAGMLSAPYVAVWIGNALVSGLSNGQIDDNVTSTGTRSGGYSYRINSNTRLGSSYVREKINGSTLRSWQFDFQHDYQPNNDYTAFSGMSLSRVAIKHLNGDPTDHATGFQLDLLGLRKASGALYGYVALGVGFEGSLHGGLGVQF